MEDRSHERQELLSELTSGHPPITDEKVIDAIRSVPRHEFVLQKEQRAAYANHPLPIGYGQTISQPYIVALMTELLQLTPEETVLEIGTGSGYQAAVLSPLAKDVYTIEIVEPLAESAAETLSRLGYRNVHTQSGDGYRGWPEHSPYDAVIVTCAPSAIPEPLVDQLKEGGKMIIPVGPEEGHQELYLLEKRGGEILQKSVIPVRFVPMTGKASG